MDTKQNEKLLEEIIELIEAMSETKLRRLANFVAGLDIPIPQNDARSE